jgi:TRAP-type uncharacterized transport system fused permease subunit
MGAAVEGVKLAKGLFIVPLMMVYSPLLLTGDTGWGDVLVAAMWCSMLIVALAVAVEGWAKNATTNIQRLLAACAAPLLLYPSLGTRLIGATALAAALALNFRLDTQKR